MSTTFQYPLPKRENITETFFEREISDPFRALEDPDAIDTVKYVNDQNAISVPFLENVPAREYIEKKLTELWNFEKFTTVSKHGKKYFYSHNSGLQNQNVYYYQDSLDQTSPPQVFIDPNALSEDGTVSITGLVFSKKGDKVAYCISEKGSDWIKIKFKDVDTMKDYDDLLQHSKFFTPAWTKDGKGVFYGRFPVQDENADGRETNTNENQKVYYHRLGESQDKDILVAEFVDQPNWRFSVDVSDCGSYLVLNIMYGCNDSLLYFARLGSDITGKLDFTKVVTKFEADFEYITNEKNIFYFRTNKDALNYRIIAIDFDNPDESNWKTFIAEHEKNVLDWAACVHNDKLVLHYIVDVKSVLQVFSLKDGKFLFQLDLKSGSVQGFSGDKENSEFFIHFVSFLEPGTIYSYDFNGSNELKVFKQVQIDNFDSSLYTVEQRFYSSKDGEKIPMFIVKKKENQVTPRPCLLYGYGGFNISILPCFSITLLAFVDMFDGVICYASIRGGGEYGLKWHNGGRLLNKQNVFNDFQCAAEYLVENNFTKKEMLAIQGGSNGGLLVGACINQRPDLFGAAIAQVGVFDMLRFHKFTIGSAWISDYGSPDEEVHFNNLIKYSPIHNVHTPQNANEEYPNTLILTADHDDRVSPLHSLKFAASLHYAVKDSPYQKRPILLRIYSKAGHGGGKPVKKKIEEATDILTFLYKTLNITKKLPF